MDYPTSLAAHSKSLQEAIEFYLQPLIKKTQQTIPLYAVQIFQHGLPPPVPQGGYNPSPLVQLPSTSAEPQDQSATDSSSELSVSDDIFQQLVDR